MEEVHEFSTFGALLRNFVSPFFGSVLWTCFRRLQKIGFISKFSISDCPKISTHKKNCPKLKKREIELSEDFK